MLSTRSLVEVGPVSSLSRRSEKTNLADHHWATLSADLAVIFLAAITAENSNDYGTKRAGTMDAGSSIMNDSRIG